MPGFVVGKVTLHVHERWLGLVEGVDLENVPFSVLKLIDIACGSPWTQAVSW